MTNIPRSIINSFASKKLVFFISVIILINLVVALMIVRNNQYLKLQTSNEAMIEKVANVVHYVGHAKPEHRKKIVEEIGTAYVVPKVSLTKKPLWPLHFYDISTWNISTVLRSSKLPNSFSIFLQPGQWLNVKIEPYNDFEIFTFCLFLILEFSTFGGILIFLWSVNRYARPLSEFTESVKNLGFNLQSAPLQIDGPQVVRNAANAINEMQQRIRDLLMGRVRMTASISHDLRTPITRMQLRAQLIEQESLQRGFISDLNEMNAMITDILNFAKEDVHFQEKVVCDFISLLEVTCSELVDIGCDVVFKTKLTRLPFLGHRLSLKRALRNLINNATLYGKKAKVFVVQRKNSTVVIITDSGPGIPENEMKNVFQPFYRGKQTPSTDNASGSGLGMAIAYDIIQAHGGEIHLKNLYRGGLQVKIIFPFKKRTDEILLNVEPVTI